MGYEMYQRDSYNFTLMTGGRKNKYNSPGHGKPSKPGNPSPQGGTGHNNNHKHDDDEDDSDHDNNDHPEQSHPPQQGAFQPAPGAYYASAYSTPYPYQCPPPPYPNQVAVGGNHVPGYPGSWFVPHQGGYGNHGGAHMNDVGLVGAAIGIATFGAFQLLRERRRRH